MKNPAYIIFLSLCLGHSCGKKEKEGNDNFPVLSFIKSQVMHVDTSLYPIIKIVRIDSLADTTYIRREDFRKEAEDFLTIPDLAEKEFKDAYSESRIFDETLNKVIITYLPLKDNMEIQRQEVLIEPGQSGNNDDVKSLIIDYRTSAGDSTISKKLLWQVNESFQVVTSVQKENKTEKITTLEVIWNRREN